MIGTTLQRMIFWELVRVFGLALCGLTGLFLLGGVVQEASQRGLTPAQIFYVVPLLIPNCSAVESSPRWKNSKSRSLTSGVT